MLKDQTTFPSRQHYSKRLKRWSLKTDINFKRADWISFTEFIEEELESIGQPSDGATWEKRIRKIVLAARSKFIPAGRIQTITPGMPRETINLAKRRDEISKNDPLNPQIQALNAHIGKLVGELKLQKWREHLNRANFGHGPQYLWETFSSLKPICLWPKVMTLIGLTLLAYLPKLQETQEKTLLSDDLLKIPVKRNKASDFF